MRSASAMLLQGLMRNLVAGMRLALFLPVTRHAFRVSPGDYALLCAFNLAAWCAGGMLRVGFPGYMEFSALTQALAEIPLFLLASMSVAYWYGKRDLTLALALMLIAPVALFECASVLIVIALRTAGQAAYAMQMLLYATYLAWILAAAVRALWIAAGWRRAAFVRSAALLVAMLFALIYWMPRSELWQPAQYVRDDQASIAQEELFHAQDGMLDAKLAALQPQREGVADLYFVGFAPDGSEDVFGKELRTVARVMRERFDAGSRMLLLANDPATLGELPIASATNLRAALAHLGRTMNPEEDVLFLYITTHGTEDGELTVDLAPLELHQLRPAALARMLRDSGILWKVLVISACYSGGFIAPLQDEHTLIITATDARSQSFGCGNGQDITWFGKAYFDTALRRTRSFTEAFELARREVDARERGLGYAPSHPQVHLGAAMRAKLAALEARLAATAP